MPRRSKRPSPATLIRERLEDARRKGRTFEEAWSKASALPWSELVSDSETREDWKAATEACREAWRRAYERRPDPKVEALTMVAPNF